MHSFHHSRGRIFFEALCALTISASCVGAWMDLGTLAFLPAAAVSALYGFAHLFDMRARRPAVAFAAPAVAAETETQGDLLAYADERAQAPAAEQGPSFVELVEEAAPVIGEVPAEEPAKRPRKRKSSRKTDPVEEVVPIAQDDPVDAEADVAAVEAVEQEAPVADAEPAEPELEEVPEEHTPVTPLFEPEPFVRQQRAVFGRKAG